MKYDVTIRLKKLKALRSKWFHYETWNVLLVSSVHGFKEITQLLFQVCLTPCEKHHWHSIIQLPTVWNHYWLSFYMRIMPCVYLPNDRFDGRKVIFEKQHVVPRVQLIIAVILVKITLKKSYLLRNYRKLIIPENMDSCLNLKEDTSAHRT